MLKATILAAVESARKAVQDLAVECEHVVRGMPVHIPGVAPQHSETLTDVSVVFTRYETKEIDGDRIRASDYKGLLFPGSLTPVPDTNDFIRVAEDSKDVAAGDYRVIYNDKVMAGDTVALSQLHLRLA